jgi:hypothetical protein
MVSLWETDKEGQLSRIAHSFGSLRAPQTFCLPKRFRKKNWAGQKVGIWSLDRISLDLFTRSKVSVNFGTRSNVVFVTRTKV